MFGFHAVPPPISCDKVEQKNTGRSSGTEVVAVAGSLAPFCPCPVVLPVVWGGGGVQSLPCPVGSPEWSKVRRPHPLPW